MNATVIGGGSWGSAFALYLGRLNIKTNLWIREHEIFNEIQKTRENRFFLPHFVFSESVSFFHNIRESLNSAEVIFLAVPSIFCRQIYDQIAPLLCSDHIVVSLTKGMEEGTLKRMSEVIEEVLLPFVIPHIAVLSGPSFAKEVAEGHPTAVVVASKDGNNAKKIQNLISSLTFRVYTSKDVIGVELAGALKNVIAIAAGISDALQFGYNSKAALITRGIAEISRLGMKLGAKRETFSGLAGIGDLVLTCTGELSRNRYLGYELGKGKSLSSVVSSMNMVAEGVTTTLSVREFAIRENIEMPICEQIYQVLYENKDPKFALNELMSRKLKDE